MSDGFLAIWSDIGPEHETDYLHWMTREHALERLSIPGFLGMRMFRMLGVVERRYFILYELENAAVVGTPDYLARLNQPSDWTRRIMPNVSNFVRGGGRVHEISGTGHGGFLGVLPFGAGAIADAEYLAARITKDDRIVSGSVLVTDHGQTAIPTREKGMRAGDRSFDGLLLMEGLDLAAVNAALASLPAALAGAAVAPGPAAYETIFALDRRSL